jgi:hypothetical protein
MLTSQQAVVLKAAIFANTSGGDGSTRALSATMTFEGFLTAADIETARLS